MQNNVNNLEQFSRSSFVVKVSIAAGAIYSLPCYGDSFYLLGATLPVEIKTDLTAYKPYRKGTGEKFPEQLRFGRIEVLNPNVDAVVLTLWVGFGEYIDNRFEILENYTVVQGSSTVTIGAGATVTFTGAVTGQNIQRKAFLISNLDPSNPVILRDSAGNNCAAVFPQTSVMIPVSGEIRVHNSTGAAISVYMSEIFYRENAS